MQTDKVVETRSRLLDMYNNQQINAACWYERSVFFIHQIVAASVHHAHSLMDI